MCQTTDCWGMNEETTKWQYVAVYPSSCIVAKNGGGGISILDPIGNVRVSGLFA